jgi:hypothetical protein
LGVELGSPTLILNTSNRAATGNMSATVIKTRFVLSNTSAADVMTTSLACDGSCAALSMVNSSAFRQELENILTPSQVRVAESSVTCSCARFASQRNTASGSFPAHRCRLPFPPPCVPATVRRARATCLGDDGESTSPLGPIVAGTAAGLVCLVLIVLLCLRHRQQVIWGAVLSTAACRCHTQLNPAATAGQDKRVGTGARSSRAGELGHGQDVLPPGAEDAMAMTISNPLFASGSVRMGKREPHGDLPHEFVYTEVPGRPDTELVSPCLLSSTGARF